jgi:hypothetical protein
MTKTGSATDLAKCSFCSKYQKQVAKLIAGAGVYICNECVRLCVDIIEEEVATHQEPDTEPEQNHDEIDQLRSLGRRLSRPPQSGRMAGRISAAVEAVNAEAFDTPEPAPDRILAVVAERCWTASST